MGRSRRSRRRERYDRPSEVLTGPLTLRLPRAIPTSVVRAGDFRPVQDARRYSPIGHTKPAYLTSGGPASVVTSRPSRQTRAALPYRINFATPHRVIVCLKRKARKEVLHALGFTGRGRGGGKKHFTWKSKIGC